MLPCLLMIQPKVKCNMCRASRATQDPFPGRATFPSLERDMAHIYSHFSPTAADTNVAQSKDKWPDYPEPECVRSY